MTLCLYQHAVLHPLTVGDDRVTVCVSRLAGSGRTQGAARRLLLLHGNPATMQDFRPLAAVLRDDFELMAVDLPGFGRSQAVPTPGTQSVLDVFARHVAAVASELGFTEPYYVLGHSHGGGVAQTLAARFPERVAGVVCLGSLGTPAHLGYRQLALPGAERVLGLVAKTLRWRAPLAVQRRIVQSVMRPIFSPLTLTNAWIDEQLALLRERPDILVQMARVARGDPCGQLARDAARITAPVLFIHGDSDRLVPASHPLALHHILQAHTYSEFHVLDGCGHMLQLSHAQRIRRLILEWLERTPVAARTVQSPG